ncbi:hypothetical protein OAO87_03820, partial [bacterium]|nr:hypothetical protein [bacterium]
ASESLPSPPTQPPPLPHSSQSNAGTARAHQRRLQAGGCTETCYHASDEDCDDGRPGAECMCNNIGTDCTNPATRLLQPGELQAGHTAASPGDELVLVDGTYTRDCGYVRGSDNVLVINKDITIRAENSGRAMLDGGGVHHVVHIGSSTISFEGLQITNGYVSVRESSLSEHFGTASHHPHAMATVRVTMASGFDSGFNSGFEVHSIVDTAIGNATFASPLHLVAAASSGSGIEPSEPLTAVALLADVWLLSAKEMMPRHLRGFWSRALQPATALHQGFVHCVRLPFACVFLCYMAALCTPTSPNAKVVRSRSYLVLMLLLLAAVPMATALQEASGTTHEKAGGAGYTTSFEADSPSSTRSFDAAASQMLVNASTSLVTTSHVARRLAVINVQPGAGTLQAAFNLASPGDELVLADGTYTGNGINALNISKDITIRALNAGQAVLDGENARRVVYITSGTVVLDGLNITWGRISSVRFPTQTLPSFRRE